MKYKVVLLFLLGVALVKSAPSHRVMPACLEECDLNSGPVCGIDASGMPRTFDSRCMAMLAFCRFGTYFAEVKPGEC